MYQKMKNGLSETRKKFLTGLPVILFYLFLFYTVVFIFWVDLVMTVSIIKVYLKINNKKNHTV